MKRCSFVRNMFLMTTLISFLQCQESVCQSNEFKPVDDIFKVMDIVYGQKGDLLWPGFDAYQIPLLVYDSVSTWAFHMKTPPEGFKSVTSRNEVWVFEGRHPVVQGNSVAMLSGTRVATSVMSSKSRRTGEEYSSEDLAGIIIHEQFHVFQKSRYPHWMQNDGLLLVYPPETEQSLFLRRMEKEAFKRAVLSDNQADMCGWAMEAIRYRKLRLTMVDPDFRRYEMELQRSEGLSDYVEKKVRNSTPLDASEMTDGIAPAGIRDLGYVEGRWIAMILDKLSPGWKNEFVTNDNLFLEDILNKVIGEPRCEAKNFTGDEVSAHSDQAVNDLINSGQKKSFMAKEFQNLSGFSLEIDAISKPLSIRIFEPLAFQILEDGSLYHSLIFSAANEAGNLRVTNQPCLTWLDNRLGIERIIINGIEEMPEFIGSEKRILLRNNNIVLDLKYSSMMMEDSIIRIEL